MGNWCSRGVVRLAVCYAQVWYDVFWHLQSQPVVVLAYWNTLFRAGIPFFPPVCVFAFDRRFAVPVFKGAFALARRSAVCAVCSVWLLNRSIVKFPLKWIIGCSSWSIPHFLFSFFFLSSFFLPSTVLNLYLNHTMNLPPIREREIKKTSATKSNPHAIKK